MSESVEGERNTETLYKPVDKAHVFQKGIREKRGDESEDHLRDQQMVSLVSPRSLMVFAARAHDS